MIPAMSQAPEHDRLLDRSLHSGERPLPWGVNYLRHLVNYRFLMPFVAGRRVLDVGCGSGYGAALLGQGAAEVTGVDLSEESVRYAKAHFASGNVSFQHVAGGELLAHFPEGSFTAVTCIMVIEHIPRVERFVEAVARLLPPGGLFCVATNNREVLSPKDLGFHFHERELTPAETTELLAPYFERLEFYGLFENDRIQKAEEVTTRGKALFTRVTQADLLKLRRLIPQKLRKTMGQGINRFIHRRVAPLGAEVAPDEIQESDFSLRAESYSQALHFLCIARRKGA